MRQAKINQFTEEEVREIIQASSSYAECCRKLGYSDKGRHGPDAIKKYCALHNIDTNHFSSTSNAHKASTKYTLDEILVEESTYTNITRLKSRLLSEHRLEYKCAICGNLGMWLNQSLTLELDHINGKHLDHRISNLRFLCPNCHSQTTTYSGRNKTTTN